ncbi:MAG: pitrilysin family protein [Bryobacteraceae bacterium]|nr:pitrilysin family protein [Bryobacteraceae bacterium]
MSTVLNIENVRADRLSNGLMVISERMPHVRSVTAGIWVVAGSRHETRGENGISHFIEHMVFKGTARRTAADIARETDSLGGNLDAYTSKELVCFNCKVLDQHLPRAFDILSDMALHPTFAGEDIDKEKGVVLEEIKMEKDTPEYVIHDIFSSSFWKGHALGKPILGTNASIKRLDRNTIRGFYERNYVPSNLVIAAAGNLTHEQLMALAQESFGGLAPAAAPIPTPAPAPNPELIFKNKRSLEQVHICIGVPCYELPHAMRYPMYVLNTILGGGMSSRLFQTIRETHGLAYSVMSEQFLYRDSGCLSVYAGTSLASVPEVVRLTMAEFRSLKDTPVPADELQRAKDHLKGSFMLGLESTTSRMSHLARQHIYFGRFSTMDEILDAVEAVTAEDVQRLANEFFQTEKIAVTVLGRLDGFQIGRESLVC